MIQYARSVTKLREMIRKINIAGPVRVDEPMRNHTTFGVGGPADIYAEPASISDLSGLLALARDAGIPYFVLGGGANILVSDRGIRGLVIQMSRLNRIDRKGTLLTAGCGLPMSDAAVHAAEHGLAGLEFLYAMPGTVGGAIWMNARCYGGEIADVLRTVTGVSEDGAVVQYSVRAGDWSYKRSPFQDNRTAMVEAEFTLHPGEAAQLWARMREIESDRRAKGHFMAPSAGSVFKNDRALGKPSGALLDSIGMRGFRIGDAMVSPRHANIVINRGSATATDLRQVIETMEQRARTELGVKLEREVLFVGEWR